jgi:hypothetical protein
MTATPYVALVDLFENPTGTEYTLPWSSGSDKTQKGWVRMSDFMFNYYFFPIAFGLGGSARQERTVREIDKPYKMTRKIGGDSVNVTRSSYKIRFNHTFRAGSYDSGHNCFAKDGKHEWNFEVGGRITEFRIWVEDRANSPLNMKRSLFFRTIEGVGTHFPKVL